MSAEPAGPRCRCAQAGLGGGGASSQARASDRPSVHRPPGGHCRWQAPGRPPGEAPAGGGAATAQHRLWPFLLHRGQQRGLNVSGGFQPDPVHCPPGPGPASARSPEVPLSPLLACPSLPQLLRPRGHGCPSAPPESAPTARTRAGSAPRTAGGATTSSSGVRSSVGTATAASGKVAGRGGGLGAYPEQGERPCPAPGGSQALGGRGPRWSPTCCPGPCCGR